MSDSNVPLLHIGEPITDKDGKPVEWFRNAFNALVLRTGTETTSSILGVINGAAELRTRIAAEAAARIAGDQATGSGGDGTGVTNGGTYATGASSGTTWVVLKTLPVTPTGAGGDYTISIVPDSALGTIAPASGGLDNFYGEWQVIEELTGGGTEHVLDSGTFEVQFTPESSQYVGEGGSEYIVIPAITQVVFTGLPSGLIAANEAAQVDIRFEIRRASGSNNVSALSGAMTVTWTA